MTPSVRPSIEPTVNHVPRVLVLMATFNGAAWLDEQVRSIAAQRGVELTLMVSDDASSDQTLDTVKAAFGSHGKLFVMRAERPSGSAARNFFRLILAADVTDHDFVALADQDDIWEPDKLVRATNCLDRSDAVGYSAAVRAFWPAGRTAVLTQDPVTTAADYVFEGAGQGCTFVMRSRFLRDTQHSLAAQSALLDSIHYHDWTLYALCRAQGQRWFFDDWSCMRYRQHSANDTGARSGRAGVGKRWALIRSGWYSHQVDAVARLCVAVAHDSAGGAIEYLRLKEAARSSRSGRLRLCAFLLRHGRRRWLDRLVLVWAGASGHLTRQKPSDVCR